MFTNPSYSLIHKKMDNNFFSEDFLVILSPQSLAFKVITSLILADFPCTSYSTQECNVWFEGVIVK